MFGDFVFDERAELLVERLEVVSYGFDGVGEILEPGHHVHDASCPHGSGELVVPAHHLLELLVVVGVPLPEAHRAHYVGRGHHQIGHGLEISVLFGFVDEQPQQLSDLAHDVVLERPLGLRVARGEHAHGGLGQFPVQLPPVGDGVERDAVPVGHEPVGGEVRSAGELEALAKQRLFDAVPVQHHHVPTAQLDLEHVAVLLRHAREVQVRRVAHLRRVADERPRERTGDRAVPEPEPEPPPQVEAEQHSQTGQYERSRR